MAERERTLQQLWPDHKLAFEFLRLARESGNANLAAKQLLQRVRDEYEAQLAEMIARASAANAWANALENQLQKLLAEREEGGVWEPVTVALPPAINDDGYSGMVEVRCIGWRGGKIAGWAVAEDEDGVAVTHWRFINCLDDGIDARPVAMHGVK
jgi:hypothetical protein